MSERYEIATFEFHSVASNRSEFNPIYQFGPTWVKEPKNYSYVSPIPGPGKGEVEGCRELLADSTPGKEVRQRRVRQVHENLKM